MKLQLTRGQNRFAAILLLLVVIAVLVGALALPTFWLHKRYDSAIEEATDRHGRYLRVAALRPTIDEAIQAAEKTDAQRFFLHGATSSLAAAELQRLVTQLVEKHKGRVATTQVLPQKEENKAGSAMKISVSVQFNASAVPLQLILHALETNEPYIFIDQVTVRSNQGRVYKAVPGVQPEFAAQMTVSAYLPPKRGTP
jgi:general secretion pathway protein M